MAEKADTSASLSEEDKQKIIEWLNEKMDQATGLICSICNTKKWIVGDDLVVAPVFKVSTIQIGGPAYPQAMLICRKCGHTVFVNAVRIGLVEAKNGEPGTPEDPASPGVEKADG